MLVIILVIGWNRGGGGAESKVELKMKCLQSGLKLKPPDSGIRPQGYMLDPNNIISKRISQMVWRSSRGATRKPVDTSVTGNWKIVHLQPVLSYKGNQGNRSINTSHVRGDLLTVGQTWTFAGSIRDSYRLSLRPDWGPRLE